MSSYDRFKETSFPSKKDCYSQLNKEDIDDKDYKHACNVWRSLNGKIWDNITTYIWLLMCCY